MEEKKIMMDAAAHYGMHAQLLKLIEELGELQREAVRMLLNGGDADHFCEEWADVLIMLEQMVYFIPAAPMKVVKYQNEKLKRLKKRIDKETGKA